MIIKWATRKLDFHLKFASMYKRKLDFHIQLTFLIDRAGLSELEHPSIALFLLSEAPILPRPSRIARFSIDYIII